MRLRRNAEYSTPAHSGQSRAWSWRSKTSCFARREGLPASPWCATTSFRYQAESWSQARRIVAKVEHHQGELFPRVGFIVTSMSLPSRSVVRFYNKRRHGGTVDQGRQAGGSASGRDCRAIDFGPTKCGMQLSVLAYNLGNLWRRLGLPQRIKSWSLTSLQLQVDEDRRSAGQARAVLLALIGGGTSEPAVVRRHAAQDLGAAAAEWVALPE